MRWSEQRSDRLRCRCNRRGRRSWNVSERESPCSKPIPLGQITLGQICGSTKNRRRFRSLARGFGMLKLSWVWLRLGFRQLKITRKISFIGTSHSLLTWMYGFSPIRMLLVREALQSIANQNKGRPVVGIPKIDRPRLWAVP
jgi:hypothetical protein